MAAKLNIEISKLLQELHNIAIENANKKVKDITLDNSLFTNEKTKELIIKSDKDKTLSKSVVKKYVFEYLKFFAGEDVAKTLNDSDIEENKENKTFKVVLEMNNANTSSKKTDNDEEHDEESTKDKANSKDKKEFSIFSKMKKSGSEWLKFARSITINVNGEPKFPIGKLIFGTTHDKNDTESKIKETINDILPNNALDYKILNSESVYNVLVDKLKVIDRNDVICKRFRESKYTLCMYAKKDDVNYSKINKELIQDVIKQCINVKVDVHLIKDYDKSAFKSQNADKVLKKQKKNESQFDQMKTSLKNKYDNQKKKIESSSKNTDDAIENLKSSILSEYQSYLNKKYKEMLDKNKDSDDFDADEKRQNFKDILKSELQKLKNLLDTGNEETVQGDVSDLYIVPLTSKTAFGKLRNSIDTNRTKAAGEHK